MLVTVDIPDELALEAKGRGMALEAYVHQLLVQEAARQATAKLRTPEEIRGWLDSLAQFSDRIPPLPETITREWIYQDHD